MSFEAFMSADIKAASPRWISIIFPAQTLCPIEPMFGRVTVILQANGGHETACLSEQV